MSDHHPIREEKERLRNELLELRRQVPREFGDAASLSAWGFLKSLPAFRNAGRVAATASFKGEIDTYAILDGALKAGKRLYLPRVPSDRSHMTFHELLDLKDLATGSFGILEPPPGRPLPPAELDLVLVPGLAFSRQGQRLGFGSGYYDRLIPLLRPDALVVGLCYSFQVLDKVPTAPHDVPVHTLLTEKGFTACRS